MEEGARAREEEGRQGRVAERGRAGAQGAARREDDLVRRRPIAGRLRSLERAHRAPLVPRGDREALSARRHGEGTERRATSPRRKARDRRPALTVAERRESAILPAMSFVLALLAG